MRHDLSPEETSQVVRFTAREITIGQDEIVPAVIIDVGKQ